MEYLMISMIWVIVGGAFNYYVYKKAYTEGILDAVAQHNRGELTYHTYEDEEGNAMIQIDIKERN